MDISRFSPLMSLHRHSSEYALAFCEVRSAHEAKKLNNHSLDRTFSNGSLINYSQDSLLRTENSGSEGNSTNAWRELAHQLPFPLELDCHIIVKLRDHPPATSGCTVPWMDYSQYIHVTSICQQLLDNLLKRDDASPASAFLRSGILKLFVLPEDSSNPSLLALERFHYGRDWVYHVPRIALKFGFKYNLQKLFLEVHWDCDFIPLSTNPEEPLIDHVWNQIHVRLSRNECWGEKEFLSRKEFKAIFTDQIVEALISSDQGILAKIAPENEMPKFVKSVKLSGTHLLAICIYGHLPLTCLHKLLRAGIEDSHLPLKILPEGARGTHCDHVLHFQDLFVPFDFHCAPDDGEKFHRLGPKTVVPLFEKGKLGEGGYGEVFEVEIHPEHHDFTPNPEARFALKRFKFLGATLPKDPNQDPEQEKILLDQLVGLRNPNITVPLAAWEQSGIFYMLFPKAECSLKKFLNEQPAPYASNDAFLQLVRQLINLAHALDSIHNMRSPLVGAQTQHTSDRQQSDSQGLAVPLDRLTIRQQTGYHHDLKPDNILIFPGGVWTINDFGTARIHEAVANSSYRTPNLNGGEPTYAPPDYENMRGSSRPYDIWSLGCIFLEIMIWLFSSGSGKGLADFAISRATDTGQGIGGTDAFWYMKDGQPDLRPSVKRQFIELKKDASGKSQFLNLVNLTEKMLLPDSRKRPEAAQIRSRLEAMEQEALRSASRGEGQSGKAKSMHYPATLHSQGQTVEDGPASSAEIDENDEPMELQLSPQTSRKRRLSSASNEDLSRGHRARPRLSSVSVRDLQAGHAPLSSPVPSIVLDDSAVVDSDMPNAQSVLPPAMKLEDFR